MSIHLKTNARKWQNAIKVALDLADVFFLLQQQLVLSKCKNVDVKDAGMCVSPF